MPRTGLDRPTASIRWSNRLQLNRTACSMLRATGLAPSLTWEAKYHNSGLTFLPSDHMGAKSQGPEGQEIKKRHRAFWASFFQRRTRKPRTIKVRSMGHRQAVQRTQMATPCCPAPFAPVPQPRFPCLHNRLGLQSLKAPPVSSSRNSWALAQCGRRAFKRRLVILWSPKLLEQNIPSSRVTHP